MTRSTIPDAELDEFVRTALERPGKGLSASQVWKLLPRAGRPSAAALFDRLRELARTGVLHPWPGGRAPLFAARPFDVHLRERLLSALAERPRTVAELRKGVPTAAHPLVGRLLDEQVREGRVYRHPRLGRRQEFALQPADPVVHLTPLVQDAIAKTIRKGFTEAAVRTALARIAGAPNPPPPPTEDPAELIRRTILELNPRAAESALVYLPHVRVAVGDRLDKALFDRTLLALLSQQRVQLQAHPVPSQLTAEEKQAMVPDGRGSYYMAVGLR